MRKSKSLNFSFSILALFLSGNCNAQSNVLEIYQNKLLEIDTTRYFNIELSRSKHIIGGKTDFIYISASQIHLGEKISTFIDSTKKFYWNGTIERIQIQNELGVVTATYEFDKNGLMRKSCEYTLPSDYLSMKYDEINHNLGLTCRKYKKGKLIYTGKYQNGNKTGTHIWYNLDGSVRKKIDYKMLER